MIEQHFRGDVLLLGNGPAPPDVDRLVARADTVVRFNQCESARGDEEARTDVLAVNATGQPGLNMLDKGLPRCASTATVFFARNVEVHWRRYRQFGLGRVPKALVPMHQAMVVHFGLGRHVAIPAGDYDAVFERLLGLDGAADFIMPSLGFTVLDLLAHRTYGSRLGIAGFSFEGWDGHPWRKERTLAERYLEQGLLEWHR